jgi:tetratricopeptide (TPR) repeat protein
MKSPQFASILLAAAVAFVPVGAQTPSATEVHEHLRRAAEYLRARDANSASRELRAVLALDPKNSEAYANLGVIAFFSRDYSQAAQYLHKALEIDPSLTKAEALLGICERRLGHPSAQALLEKSFPRLKDKSLQVQAGLELANLYYQQGSLDRAASTMHALVDLDPDNIEILYMAQRAYSDLADDTLNKLVVLAPGSARVQQVIAERLVNAGDLKRATEHYRKALEIDPRLPGVRLELAQAILEAQPSDTATQSEAEKELEAAVKADGDSAAIECVLARLALDRSDVDGAYTHYKQAFALDQGSSEAQLGLGHVLETMGKAEEALKYLRMAVQSEPLNDEAHYRLAMVCRKLQLKEEADKEARLFREIKQTRERVAGLYFEMNKKPPGTEESIPDAEP